MGQIIDAPDAAVAFALYAVPGYLDIIVDHFARAQPQKDFVDACTNEILNMVQSELDPSLEPFIVNTDCGPPYYHVQSIGAVAGADQHIEASDLQEEGDDAWREELSDRLEDDRDPKMWGTDSEQRRKIFGVNIHPVWGGWYAYRALLVLRKATAEALTRPPAQNFLPAVEKRRILSEYNLKHEECLWRDLTAEGHSPERQYGADEFFYFTETSSRKRHRFLQLRAAQHRSRQSH